MTKEELQKQLGILENQLKEYQSNDEQIRRNISQILGSLKGERYYDNSREVKVLIWSEIYFKLGELTSKDGFELSHTIGQRLDYLMEQDRMNKEVNKEDKKQPFSQD